ncbi:MAG: hypothetical protein ACK5DG_07575 [Chitinophagaceae bacterium]
MIDYLKLGAETTYSDELDFEESDFETSLFPMQCYGNFEKSKKIVGNGRVATSIRFSWDRLCVAHIIASAKGIIHLFSLSLVIFAPSKSRLCLIKE